MVDEILLLQEYTKKATLLLRRIVTTIIFSFLLQIVEATHVLNGKIVVRHPTHI